MAASNGAFGIEHSVEQEDYLLWKAYLLDSIFIDKKLNRRCVITRHSKKVNGFWFPSIRATLQWKDYFHKFLRPRAYRDGKKDIQYLLSQIDKDLHLAIWFMDDGGEKTRLLKNGRFNRPHYRLYTCSFTEGQINLVKQFFRSKYQIEPAVLIENGKSILSFSVEDTEKIFRICRPYFEQFISMRKKFKASFQRFDLEKENAPETGEKIVQI